jgi:acetylornithine deacetylase/succinyl-diaminopimelate desuccinylase-like protein
VEIVSELMDFLKARNVATNITDIQRNADLAVEMLRRRGFTSVRQLAAAPGTPPAVFAELRSVHARRTVVFYAHYDGQPADAKGWYSDPWSPVMRSGPPGANATVIDWKSVSGPMNPEWRLFARSASDDKGTIVAMLSAIDALHASRRRPLVNIKVFYEGEEEQSSTHLRDILEQNREMLDADVWLICDGPVHQTRRMQIFFGARGYAAAYLTVYRALRPLHSGHYGNWAPNAASMAANLVAKLRDDDGHILIPGFYENVVPRSAPDKQAVSFGPEIETALATEAGIGRTEFNGRLLDATSLPALNVLGMSSGTVGESAASAIPTEAEVALEFRLVPRETPEDVKARLETYLKGLGWTLVVQSPDLETRLSHARIARIRWTLGYPPHRTDMEIPVARALASALERWAGRPVIEVPMLGGSVPMYLFAETLHRPPIGVPIANHDNNQHSINENLRLQNLWDGIEIYAHIMADMNW